MKIDKMFQILSYEEVILFGKAQKNRKINEQHVNDFVTILKDKTFVPDEDGDMVAYGCIPIIVNPVTNHILDGQHKLKAYKDAIDRGLIPSDVKILVGYWRVNDEAHENEVTIMLNSKSKNWSLNDYLDAYAQDIEFYSKLKNFCQNHSLCKRISKGGTEQLMYRYGAAIITGKGCQDVLKQGTFAFTDDQMAVADNVHQEMADIRKKLNLRSSAEVEFMAKEWHKQRQIMTAKDIVSLKHIPASVRERQIVTQRDWREVFSILHNIIEQNKLKKEVA